MSTSEPHMLPILALKYGRLPQYPPGLTKHSFGLVSLGCFGVSLIGILAATLWARRIVRVRIENLRRHPPVLAVAAPVGNVRLVHITTFTYPNGRKILANRVARDPM